MEIQLGAHVFQALPDRALYWPAHRYLLMADVHLGKADTFRQYGIAVPQAVQLDDIARIAGLIQQTRPAAVVVLGDFLHGAVHGPSTLDAWTRMVRENADTAFWLVSGNHDRHVQPALWGLAKVVDALHIDGVLLSHAPQSASQAAAFDLNIHGHVHPAFRLPGWYEKKPALVYRAPYLMLPAFSAFTAGVAQSARQDRVWVFLGQEEGVARVK